MQQELLYKESLEESKKMPLDKWKFHTVFVTGYCVIFIRALLAAASRDLSRSYYFFLSSLIIFSLTVSDTVLMSSESYYETVMHLNKNRWAKILPQMCHFNI